MAGALLQGLINMIQDEAATYEHSGPIVIASPGPKAIDSSLTCRWEGLLLFPPLSGQAQGPSRGPKVTKNSCLCFSLAV